MVSLTLITLIAARPRPLTVDASSILVLNSGSSSLKFALFRRAGDDEMAAAEGAANNVGRHDGHLRIRGARGEVLAEQDHDMPTQARALDILARTLAGVGLGTPAAVGHRIVHGGPHLRTHQALTPQVLEQLRGAVHFAPVHIPVALELVDRARAQWPDAAQFACFDTAFHRTMPPRATRLPLPARYADAGVARYGFHGLSYESLVRRLGPDLPSRAVFAHLGNGASLCAVLDGKSIDTSMGMTPRAGYPWGRAAATWTPASSCT